MTSSQEISITVGKPLQPTSTLWQSLKSVECAEPLSLLKMRFKTLFLFCFLFLYVCPVILPSRPAQTTTSSVYTTSALEATTVPPGPSCHPESRTLPRTRPWISSTLRSSTVKKIPMCHTPNPNKRGKCQITPQFVVSVKETRKVDKIFIR